MRLFRPYVTIVPVMIIRQLLTYEEVSAAYKYLANYFVSKSRLDDAYDAAQKCTQYNEVRSQLLQRSGSSFLIRIITNIFTFT